MTENERIVEDELRAALSKIEAATTTGELNDVRVAALGRKARMSQIKSGMGALSPDERRAMGMLLNQARETIEAALAAKERTLATAEEHQRLIAEQVDVTLPGRGPAPGHPHPLSLVSDMIVDTFVGMGYRVAEGPEVETDWYNFQALNIPESHPARTSQDTMFVEGTDLLMRTHTSPVQVRAMQAQEPPIYIVAPGRAYRRDPFDASHSPSFMQIEGLAIDRGLSLADLKGTLAQFARTILGPDQQVRLRPSYFQFTEPSAEVDVVCITCGGTGCSACGRSGWIEIMGAGVVHPNVLRAVGWDPEVWSGFAFGMGIERVAMTVFGVPDIRWFYDADQRFLSGFTA